jgi:hypothetical protein
MGILPEGAVMETNPPIPLEKLKTELLRQVQEGEIGKWRAFSEFVSLAHYWLPNRYQHDHIPTHIRWAADQMDDLEKALDTGPEI